MGSKHVRLGLTAMLACALLGCDQKQRREDLPNWSSGYERGPIDGGTSDASVPGGGFSLVVPDSVQYPTRLYEEGSPDAPCAVTLGDEAHNDIRCIYDTDEDNVFYNGLTLDVLVPQGGCDYVLYEPYIYASWEMGVGPTEVSYTVNEDGTFSDEVNSENGEPICKYDYSRMYQLGPNCCTGSYDLTVTSAKTGKSTVETNRTWGGPSSDCIDGAAFLREDVTFDAFGFPFDPVYYVDREHQVIHLVHVYLSDKYRDTNVPLANYWNPADGRPPAALTDPFARPDYTLTCFDNASEVLARIRFQVREWNEELQFDMRGDPDTTGHERDFDSDANDETDWKDLATHKPPIKYTHTIRLKKD